MYTDAACTQVDPMLSVYSSFSCSVLAAASGACDFIGGSPARYKFSVPACVAPPPYFSVQLQYTDSACTKPSLYGRAMANQCSVVAPASGSCVPSFNPALVDIYTLATPACVASRPAGGMETNYLANDGHGNVTCASAASQATPDELTPKDWSKFFPTGVCAATAGNNVGATTPYARASCSATNTVFDTFSDASCSTLVSTAVSLNTLGCTIKDGVIQVNSCPVPATSGAASTTLALTALALAAL